MSAESSSTTRPLGEPSLQGPGSFERFLDRNQKAIAALAAVLVIGAIGYVIYEGVAKSHEHSAGAALSQADDSAALKKIVSDYPKTTASGSARVLLADKQWTEGQQDNAITTLKDFIAADPAHPAVPTAKASLGSKLAAQGKADEATKTFEELASGENSRFLAPFALLSLGDLASAAGDVTKAEGYYQRAQNEFPDSTFTSTALTRIAQIKAKPPTEIEAPPAPPTPPAPDQSIIPGLIPPTPSPETAPQPAPQAPAAEPAPVVPTPAPQP